MRVERPPSDALRRQAAPASASDPRARRRRPRAPVPPPRRPARDLQRPAHLPPDPRGRPDHPERPAPARRALRPPHPLRPRPHPHPPRRPHRRRPRSAPTSSRPSTSTSPRASASTTPRRSRRPHDRHRARRPTRPSRHGVGCRAACAALDGRRAMIACDDCLRRTDLIAAIAGRLADRVQAAHARPGACSRCSDEELLAVGASAEVAERYASFDAAGGAGAGDRGRAVDVCRCRDEYPERLRDLADPPAVLHVLGDPGALADHGRRGGRRRPPRVDLRARRRARARPRPVRGGRDRGLRARARDRLGRPRRRARGARPHDRRARRERPRRLPGARLAPATRRSPRAAR